MPPRSSRPHQPVVQFPATGDAELGLPAYDAIKQRAAAVQSDGAGPPPRLLAGDRAHLEALLRDFKRSGVVKDQALALYVNNKVRPDSGHPDTSADTQASPADSGQRIARLQACELLRTRAHPTPSQLYAKAVGQFKDFLRDGMDAELGAALRTLRPGPDAQQALFPYFAQFVLERYVDDITAYRCWELQL